MKQKAWDRIFNIELGLAILISFILGIIGQQFKQEWSNKAFWISLVILFVIAVLRIFSQKNRYVKLVSNWLSILTLSFIFELLTDTTVSILNLKISTIASLISVIGLLLLLVVNIPLVVINFPVVKNWFLRLISITVLALSSLFGNDRIYGAPEVVHQIARTGLIFAIAMFILSFFIARAWDLRFSWNLSVIRNPNFHWLTLIILLVVATWFAFFNTYIVLAQSLGELLCFWQWDFNAFEFTRKAFMAASEAGIFEETIRCLELIVMLYALRNFKYRIIVSMLVTSLIFSLMHLTNLGGNVFGIQFDWQAVLQQMTYTFGVGMMLAAVYLYSGKLWLSMLIHFLTDLISLSKTPLSYTANPLITDGWVMAVILMLIPLIISLIMMWGKRRRVMEDHVEQIVGM